MKRILPLVLIVVATNLAAQQSTVTTLYSSSQLIYFDANPNGGFILENGARGIKTQEYYYNGESNEGLDVTSISGSWSHLYGNDRAMLDAHWGATKTYDFFKKVHTRVFPNTGFNFYDMHLLVNDDYGGSNSDNGKWEFEKLWFGVGTNGGPFVTLDMVAHEIAHGFFDTVSGTDLSKSGEPGAINESLSDIWASMVEFDYSIENTDPIDQDKDEWLLNEENGVLRSMKDPNSMNQPYKYEGEYWIFNLNHKDYKHFNAGVMSHWFYLLSEGTGDSPYTYNLDFGGMGKDKAIELIYYVQKEKLVIPGMDYVQVSNAFIDAAEDYFANPTELEFVDVVRKAWATVGLGTEEPGKITGNKCTCSSSTTTYSVGNSTFSQVDWEVSPNLEIIDEDKDAAWVKVRALSSATRDIGYIRATAGTADPVEKRIWVGTPDSPSSGISGPITVTQGDWVNYSSSSAEGASSYKWILPYTYKKTGGTPWSVISGGNSFNLRASVGTNSGLVQFVGINKCGSGGARTKYVTVSSGGGGTPIEMRIRPNPAIGDVSFEFTNNQLLETYLSNFKGIDKGMKIEIISIDGKRQVYSGNITKNGLQLNLNSLDRGVYIVRFFNEEFSDVTKLVLK